jgi:hypothetical protein
VNQSCRFEKWLLGSGPQVVDELVVPDSIFPGTYFIDVAILSEDDSGPMSISQSKENGPIAGTTCPS